MYMIIQQELKNSMEDLNDFLCCSGVVKEIEEKSNTGKIICVISHGWHEH